MLTALALVLLAPRASAQGKTPPGKPVPPKGSPVQDERPKRPLIADPVGSPATSAEILAWDGWKGVETNPLLPVSVRDYPTVIPALRPDDPTAVPFKLKVYVLTRVENDALGTERSSILPGGVERVRTAIRNAQAIVREGSAGRIDLALAFVTEEESLNLANPETDLARYLGPRINGGRFDAEDGVDRGPYSGILVVAPGVREAAVTVNGTPVRALDFYRNGGQFGGTALESNIVDTVTALMADRIVQMGGTVLPAEPSSREGWPDYRSLPSDALPALRAGVEADAAGTATIASSTWRTPAPFSAQSASAAIAPVTMYLEADPARDTVLRYQEPGEVRLGGYTLPIATPPAGKNLAFWTKISGGEGLALRTTLGNAPDETPRQQAIRTEETIIGPLDGERGAAFPYDGAWHRIVVAIPAGTSSLAFGPALGRVGLIRRDIQIVNAWFDDFEWTDEAPTPIVDGPSRANIARLGSATVADLPTLLADGSPRVRAQALTRVSAGAAELEPTVLTLTTEIEPAVAREAVRALARIGTPSAFLAIRRTLAIGPTEAARQAAAQELAKTGDPTVIPVVAILLGRQSWRSRLAAVDALGAFKQENAVRFRLSATLQDIPELRLAALRPATSANADERQKLLYAAINDPSDEIRAFASDRLLDSSDSSDVTEGGRAAADDSPWVRVLFQRALARRANPAFRALALKGTTDTVGLVRAESLRALAALGPVTGEEAGATLNDPHPEVLLALLELKQAGKIELPEGTTNLILQSRDARVRARRENPK